MGHTEEALSSIFPAMRFSWEIKSVDAVFCNGGSYGIPRINDLSKEAMLQLRASPKPATCRSADEAWALCDPVTPDTGEQDLGFLA